MVSRGIEGVWGAIHPLHGESGGQMGGELGQFTQIAVSEKTNRWGVPVRTGKGKSTKDTVSVWWQSTRLA